MGWIAGDNQWADTDARRHGNPRMSCGCEHHAQRKPKSKPSYEVVNDREDRDDEADAPSGHARGRSYAT